MEKYGEIRKILLGRTVVENELIRAVHPGEIAQTLGGANGSLTVMLLGITSFSQRIDLPSGTNSLEAAAKALLDFSAPVLLEEHPEVLAAVLRSSMREEVLYTAELEEESILLTVFTGRSITAGLTLRSAAYAFTRRMPAGSAVNKINARRVKKLEKQQEKLDKKKERTLKSAPGKRIKK